MNIILKLYLIKIYFQLIIINNIVLIHELSCIHAHTSTIHVLTTYYIF